MREPSKAQKQAIDHLSGPAQIIAGPGSGKTFTVVCRILHLIRHHHIPPEQILVITYTKAAANEMKERFENSYKSGFSDSADKNRQQTANVNFGTFHSICYNILKQSGVSKAGSLIKESDKRKLLQILLGNHGLSSKNTYDNISCLINTISRMKNLGDFYTQEQFKENRDFTYSEICLIKKEYDCYLREQKMLDFDDMITQCLKLLLENPSLRGKYQEMFRYILVDEFQDINYPQYQILKLLAAPGDNLFVVGDDDQGIYGFRGATPGIMKRFMEDFPEGKQILLTENYRSGENIVKLADQMIRRGNERFPKEFRPQNAGGKVIFSCFDTRKEEELCLIRELSSLKEDLLPDTAVILRTNIEVVQYMELLKGEGIAVKGKQVPDADIFHSFMMEDILSFLCYLYEGRKRKDFIGFMNKPNRFLARSALFHETVRREDLEQYYQKNPAMILEIRRFFGQIQIAAPLQPYLAVSFFRKTLGYDNYLRQKARDYTGYQRWMMKADKIQYCFKKYACHMPVRKFVEDQAELAGTAGLEPIETEGVSLLTMHGAKGLEFSRVFLPDVNEGVIPGRESIRPDNIADTDGITGGMANSMACSTANCIEEERRLLYVAITRAKKELFIYYTKERGRKLSRFLEGLTFA